MTSEITSLEQFQELETEYKLITEWRDEGYTWEEIAIDLGKGSETSARRYYSNLKKLVENPPKGLEHLDFTKEALSQVVRPQKVRGERYLITTITAKADTFKKPFLSLLKAAEHLDAKLVLLLGRSHNKALKEQVWYYDPWLKQFQDQVIFASEYIFNKMIRAVDLQINPQQLNPLTGIKGIDWGEDCSSVILASTQISLETVPRGNNRTPRVIVGTGTISVPNYRQETRVGRMAEQNHDCGAVMLEVVDSSKFFLRVLEIDSETGTFYDIAGGHSTKFTPKGASTARAEAWVLGDKHIGHDCLTVWKAQKHLAKITNPKKYFLHDLLDGTSGSPHTHNKVLTRHFRKFFGIADELAAVKDFLQEIKKLLPKSKGYLVDSNHHDHLFRYLDAHNYVKDKINYEIGHRMVVDVLDGINPFIKRCDPNSEFSWLGSEDDLYVEGVNMAMHGHLGPNGVKGSIKNIAIIENNAMIGHSHSPGWYRGIVQVGHSSKSRHGYNRGPSGWIKADGLIWPKGLKSLIMFIDGEFYLKT